MSGVWLVTNFTGAAFTLRRLHANRRRVAVVHLSRITETVIHEAPETDSKNSDQFIQQERSLIGKKLRAMYDEVVERQLPPQFDKTKHTKRDFH
jgi:hypothetical protein